MLKNYNYKFHMVDLQVSIYKHIELNWINNCSQRTEFLVRIISAIWIKYIKNISAIWIKLFSKKNLSDVANWLMWLNLTPNYKIPYLQHISLKKSLQD